MGAARKGRSNPDFGAWSSLGSMRMPPRAGGGGKTSGTSKIRGESMTGSASSSSTWGGAIEGRKNSSSFPLPLVLGAAAVVSAADGLAGGAGEGAAWEQGATLAAEDANGSLSEGKRGGPGRLRRR